MNIEQCKVLSINPGATERLPEYTPYLGSEKKAIIPMTDRLSRMFGANTSLYLQGSASRLLLRSVAALAFGASAWLQMAGYMSIFGLDAYSYWCGMAVLLLSALMLLGIGGRLTPLCLSAMTVISLISYAHANGGVADFSLSCQLSLIYGAIAAVVAVLGTGRFTLPCFLAVRLKKS